MQHILSLMLNRDTGEKVDPKDYTIENQRGVLTGRIPGTIRGQQFIIQNCSNSSIYLYDHIGAITVDDCSDCKMFIGPVRSRYGLTLFFILLDFG